jgi:flagellar assembly protein FliH
MALIKSANSSAMLKRAVVLDIGDLGQQAARILSRAKEEAQAVLEQARAEEQRLIGDASQRGFEQGMAKGLAEGRETGRAEGHSQALAESTDQLAVLIERWTAALNEWESQKAEMIHSAREDALIFAFELAKKVVHRMIAMDPSIVRDQVEQALRVITKPGILAVSVHPEDRAILAEALPQILETSSRCEHAEIRDDPSIARGGCVVTSARGRIDSTIQTQLDRIAQVLLPDQVRGSDASSATPSAGTSNEPPS